MCYRIFPRWASAPAHIPAQSDRRALRRKQCLSEIPAPLQPSRTWWAAGPQPWLSSSERPAQAPPPYLAELVRAWPPLERLSARSLSWWPAGLSLASSSRGTRSCWRAQTAACRGPIAADPGRVLASRMKTRPALTSGPLSPWSLAAQLLPSLPAQNAGATSPRRSATLPRFAAALPFPAQVAAARLPQARAMSFAMPAMRWFRMPAATALSSTRPVASPYRQPDWR